jgi:pimeloyl-ACP methyl ester carboxylesterase
MDSYYLLLPSLIAVVGLLAMWLLTQRLLSLRRTSLGAMRTVAEAGVLSVAAILVFAVAASSALNAVNYVAFRRAAPGTFYSVDGRRMRIDCAGGGSPALVLESGLANGGLIWDGVQSTLARTTRVCSYDRAGYGWSDPAPTPRDADHVADQLHALLASARVEGPIVLMGHSLGGIYIRDYAARYPTQVAGLIFVDSSIPLQDRKGVSMDFPPIALVQSALSIGLFRLALGLQYPAAPARAIDDAAYPNLREASREMVDFDRSGEEALRSPSFDDLPILILSHDPAADATEPDPNGVHGAQLFDRLQQELLGLSARSRRVVAKGSHHVIQFDRPQLVEAEAALFIEQLRGAAPPPARYGATETK